MTILDDLYPSEAEEDPHWTKILQSERNRRAVRDERSTQIYAYRVEDEVAIDFVLWKLLHGVSYVEQEPRR